MAEIKTFRKKLKATRCSFLIRGQKWVPKNFHFGFLSWNVMLLLKDFWSVQVWRRDLIQSKVTIAHVFNFPKTYREPY